MARSVNVKDLARKAFKHAHAIAFAEYYYLGDPILPEKLDQEFELWWKKEFQKP